MHPLENYKLKAVRYREGDTEPFKYVDNGAHFHTFSSVSHS